MEALETQPKSTQNLLNYSLKDMQSLHNRCDYIFLSLSDYMLW